MKAPDAPILPEFIEIGPWKAHRLSGELRGPGITQTLEPKVRDLLFLLAARRGEVVTREEIMAALWPRVIVGEDSLARCVFKLRKALGDEARAPRYVETLSKRGYRLMREAPPTAPTAVRRAWGIPAGLALLAVMYAVLRFNMTPESLAVLGRADDFYHQMSQVQNEAAIELYQRLVDDGQQLAGAYAGLANAYTQRAIRWPHGAQTSLPYTTLREALRGGEMRHGYAAEQLRQARTFARQAIAVAPDDARGHKALGLALSASGDLAGALASHQRAIALNPDAWESFIDAGDVLEISGRASEALPYFEAGHATMTRQLATHAARIMPWYAATAVLIGDRHEQAGAPVLATQWFRRALDYAPLDANATRRLARRLAADGDPAGAGRLCEQLRQRVNARESCATM